MKKLIFSYEPILQLVFVLFILTSLFIIISKNSSRMIPNYWQRFPSLKRAYFDSQYATKHPHNGWISDAAAYSYAGGALIAGTNPILVIPEAPPLGKYLIGFSAITFNNENVITIIFAIFSLIFLFLLSQQVLQNTTLALLPPLLWVMEPLFKDQVVNGPLFDIFQLVFLLLTLYFFNKGYLKSKQKSYIKYFAISFFFLGLFIATKFFISGLIMIAAGATVLFFKKQYQKLMLFFCLIPLSVLLLLLSYIRVFAFGYGLMPFLGIQKWIFLYHKSQFILPFSIWPLVLINKWYVWFGRSPVISDGNWTITWPIITILSLVAIILYLLGKIKHKEQVEILLAWTFFFFLFFSFGQIFSRYLVIVIPIMYIVSIFVLREFIKTCIGKNENKK